MKDGASPGGGSAIHCHEVVRRYGDVVALDRFELEVPERTILGLLGPSGCGKTTALRIIAGFDRPDAGSVAIRGVEVASDHGFVPPERRRVGMVFQDYALFPHMTVARNVGYGLSGRDPEDTRLQIDAALQRVGLAGFGGRMPHELSGGEQQRVALARALAPSPGVILLDEPFSNLDATLRDKMRRDVRTILTDAGITAVFVTHDQEEALAVSDVVAVMRAGTVVQVGPPHQLYRRPRDPWVAGFVGDSEFVAGTAEVGRVVTPLGTFPHVSNLRGDVLVMIRPEWIRPVPDTDGTAVVVDQEFYGHDQLIILELPGGNRLSSRIGANPILRRGDRVSIGIDEVVVFPT